MKTIVIATFGQWVALGLVIGLALAGVMFIFYLCFCLYLTKNGGRR